MSVHASLEPPSRTGAPRHSEENSLGPVRSLSSEGLSKERAAIQSHSSKGGHQRPWDPLVEDSTVLPIFNIPPIAQPSLMFTSGSWNKPEVLVRKTGSWLKPEQDAENDRNWMLRSPVRWPGT